MSTLAFLRRGAVRAAEKHAARQDRATLAISRLTRRRDAYADVAQAVRESDPRHTRAAALAECCAWRLLAWVALAEGDAETAAQNRRKATRSFRSALAVVVP